MRRKPRQEEQIIWATAAAASPGVPDGERCTALIVVVRTNNGGHVSNHVLPDDIPRRLEPIIPGFDDLVPHTAGLLLHPGATQSEIALNLGVSRQTINYHIRAMEEMGAVRIVRNGRTSLCYPAIRPGPSTT